MLTCVCSLPLHLNLMLAFLLVKWLKLSILCNWQYLCFPVPAALQQLCGVSHTSLTQAAHATYHLPCSSQHFLVGPKQHSLGADFVSAWCPTQQQTTLVNGLQPAMVVRYGVQHQTETLSAAKLFELKDQLLWSGLIAHES